MGTQPFASVPYALAAETAVNTKNIGGNPVEQASTPSNGDLLRWDGTLNMWKPSRGPIVGSWAGTIAAIPFGGGAAPFVFAGPTFTVTVDGTQKIMATATGVFGHVNVNNQPCSFAICWSAVPAGSVLSAFQGSSYPDGTVTAGNAGEKTNLTATGVITLPAGTYKIGFGLKNKSTNTNFGANDYVNGTFMIIN